MKLLFKIAAVALLHAAFFACYPETGPYGNYYLAGSLLVWGVFVTFLNTSAKLVTMLSGAAGFVVNLAAFALMALAIAFTMPQRDKTSVLDKLKQGRYPDRDTVNSGMLRFGIRLDRNVKTGMEGFDAEVKKAMKKLKEEQ